MEKSARNPDKLSEALKLLDEAAKEKKDELRNLLRDGYQHLKDLVMGFDSKKSIDNVKKSTVDAAHRAKDYSEERIKEIATNVDQNIHTNPWPYLGGVAAISLLLGFILGRKD